jgi:cell division protein FtsN
MWPESFHAKGTVFSRKELGERIMARLQGEVNLRDLFPYMGARQFLGKKSYTMNTGRWLFLLGVVAALHAPMACNRGESRPLPLAGFKVEFGKHEIPSEMIAGQRVSANVTVKNISSRTWPSKPNEKGQYAVALSYHWLDRKNRTVVFEGLRTPLPHDVGAGESVQLNAAIQAPDRAGRYTLEVTLVQEFVAWFPERDGDIVALPINVRNATTARSDLAGTQPANEVGSPPIHNEIPSRGVDASKSHAEKKGAEKPLVQKHQANLAQAEVDKTISEKGQQTHPWSVQIGSFATAKEAEALEKRLKDKGYDTYVAVAEVRGKNWYRVRVGHLASRVEAEKLHDTLRRDEKLERSIVTAR